MNIMKKLLCLLIVCAMALSVVCFSVSAETEFSVDATVNYDTSVVTVEITTPARYVQKISVVMYEKDSVITAPTDFIRAFDVYTDGSGYASKNIQLAEDDPAGYITISAAGNGTKASVSKDTTDIYFESQTYIEEVTLPAIESADRTEIETLLLEKADMLSIDKEDYEENKAVICNLFMNIREEDYGNECNDMGTVVDILSGVQLIRDINDASTQEECKTLCEDESTLLTLDVTDNDYASKENDIYELFYANAKNEAPETITDVKNDLFQSIAMANLNKLNATNNGETIEKYIESFGISLEDYQEACKKHSASEINKAFAGRNFVLAKDVVSAFNDVVKNAETESSGGGGSFAPGKSNKTEEIIVDEELMNVGDNKEILPEIPAGSMFNDVPKEHWAFRAVNELHSMGVIEGVSANTFDPESSVTREAYVKMLVMAFDIYDETALTIFTDLLGHWSNIYVASAHVQGIVTGIDNHTFGVGMPITRQDAAVMLNRLITKKGIIIEEGEEKVFSDEALISDYAKESVSTLTKAGVISGMTDTEFQPTGTLTRAQAAKLIYGAVSR